MSSMRLALRMLARDWRAGELRVLALALLIAVASVTSVSFFADRVRQGLSREAHQLLGGDLLMAGDQAWKPEVIAEIRRRGLAVAQSTNFISMAQSVNGEGPKSLLTGAKAVTESYPLRGRLRIAPRLNAPDAVAQRGPLPGTVWLDERLTSALAAKGRGQSEARERRIRGRGRAHARARPRRQLLQHRAAAHDGRGRRRGDRPDPDRQPGHLPGARRGRGRRTSTPSRPGPGRASSAGSVSRASRTRGPKSAPRSTARKASSG